MDDRKIKELSIEGVLRRIQPTKHFVYSVRVTWSDGMVNVVYRQQKDFLQLQESLLDQFSRQQDSIPTLRCKTPNSPESALKYVDDVAAFVGTLINLPASISSCNLVLDFFTLTEEDLSSIIRAVPNKPSKVSNQEMKTRNNQRNKKKGRRRARFTRRMKTIKDGLISGPVVFDQYIVLESYKKQNKNDIDLTQGQVVEVIEKRDNGWWFVELDEQLGWAPASFLRHAELDVEDDFIITKFPRGKGEIYMTTKTYKAAMPDELSFGIGMNLQIMERNYAGWWWAVYMGKEGYVPAAYLKKIGAGRHSVKLQDTREKKISVVSRLEATIPEEPGEDGTNSGTGRTKNGLDPYALLNAAPARKFSPSTPYCSHSLPAGLGSNPTPGSTDNTMKTSTLPPPGRSVSPINDPTSTHLSTLKLPSVTMSHNGGQASQEKNRKGGREKRMVSFSEPESESDGESSLSSQDKDGNIALVNETMVFSGNDTVAPENEIHVEVHPGDQVNGVENGDDETDSEEEDDGYDREGATLRALGDLPSPPLAPPHKQRRREYQGKASYQTPSDAQEDESTFDEKALQSALLSNGHQESDESSIEEEAVDISALIESPCQPQQARLLYKAISSYEGDDANNELSLAEGDVVEVLQQESNGWWMGLSRRQIGWVPSNYVEPLAQDIVPSAEDTNHHDTRL